MLVALRTAIKAYVRPLPLNPHKYLFKKSITPEIISVQLSKKFPPVYLRKNETDVTVFNNVFHRREYDIDFREIPEVIVDGGANIGLTSVFFAQKFPDATIVAVEPEPGNFAMLKRNTAPYPNVRALNCGLWNKSTNLRIIDYGEGAWAFVVTEVPEAASDTVKAMSIRDLMQEQGLTKIDLLKIDIEGSEKELFEEGAGEWLPYVRTIVVELHDRFKKGCTAAVIKALQPFEYSLEPSCECIVIRLTAK